MKGDGDITSRWYGKKTYVLYVVMQLACRRAAYKAFLYQLLAMAMLHVLSLFATLPKSNSSNLKIIALKKETHLQHQDFAVPCWFSFFFVTFLRMTQRLLKTDDLAFIRINHKSWEKKI